MPKKKDKGRFWIWATTAVLFRIILIYFPNNLNLSSRPEVSTPLTSIRRLAEGYWLKQSSVSPYAGSMYHGSPLLLSVLGPLTVKRIEGQPKHLLCSLVFVIADIVNAMLLRAIGRILQTTHSRNLKLLDRDTLTKSPAILPSREIAAIVYLWNPFTIVACVGLSTSPIENLAILSSLYGASTRLLYEDETDILMTFSNKYRHSYRPQEEFPWQLSVGSWQLISLYPVILIVPVILLLGYGPDSPPRKYSLLGRYKIEERSSSAKSSERGKALKQPEMSPKAFSWRLAVQFFLWAILWLVYVLALCGLYTKEYGGLQEMINRTYGFILTVQDLSPNIGVLWYFFAEVFHVFRNFFLFVFHINILFMVLPLTIRLNHRPCFLAFVYITISSMFKSYPSVGDAALYLGLMGLFVNELADMQFSLFLFCVYVGVSLLSPVMHNLWIWRGTGNANFYFATAMAYACLQIVLVAESVSATLNHDRKLQKQSITKLEDSKS